MRSLDIKNRDDLRALMQKALKDNDTDAFYDVFDQMMESIANEIREEYTQAIGDARAQMDNDILTARGVRRLTAEEKAYYTDLAEAMKSRNPKQAVSNLDKALPETVINAVFDELSTRHPLLSKINFVPSSGAVKVLMNTNGEELATWSTLCDEVVKELTAGLKEVDTTLKKLSAFLPVCKAMLDLGPEWIDRFVRETLYEALANGMEYGLVAGDGNDEPIGMVRDIGPTASVVGGAYPKKSAITVNSFDAETVGNLLGLIAVNENGKARRLNDIILVVNPADYYTKVMPATTVMAPDGTYRNDVMPFPMSVIQSGAVDVGEAVFGIAPRYFATAGTSKDGRIEYSDHYHFLEDERVYLIKAYANGMPMDNNAFLRLDISGITPAAWKFEQVSRTANDDATLAALAIGSLTLSPTFAAETTTYTANTTNATNVINATPADASASIAILVNGTAQANGTAATWEAGSNTVSIAVTAEDGTTTKTYTVTVTKS